MRIACVLLMLALAGCGKAFISNNRDNLSRLNLTMTKDEVHQVMGRESHGYSSNPYRTAMHTSADGKPVEVLYYWTDHTGPGVPDRDLTPVVLVDGRVVGWGREFWTEYVTKLEVRIKSQ